MVLAEWGVALHFCCNGVRVVAYSCRLVGAWEPVVGVLMGMMEQTDQRLQRDWKDVTLDRPTREKWVTILKATAD